MDEDKTVEEKEIQEIKGTQEETAIEIIAPRQSMSLVEAQDLAKVFISSGLFKDTHEVSQAVVKILAGQELGIGAFTAMRGINIIEGQLAPNAGLTSALIKQHPEYDYRVVSSTREKCEIEFFFKGESIGHTMWDMRDAELAGVVNKYNWKKYPRAMLFARAMTEGARQHVPHIFMGSVYVPEELGAEHYEVSTDLIEVEVWSERQIKEVLDNTPWITEEKRVISFLDNSGLANFETPKDKVTLKNIKKFTKVFQGQIDSEKNEKEAFEYAQENWNKEAK